MRPKLPKVELHCHLDGIVDPPMLEQLKASGQRLPLALEALLEAYPVDSFESFEKWHRTVSVLEGNLDNFRPILAIHAERLKKQGVGYAEIMIGSSEIPRDRDELVGRMKDFRAFVDTLEQGQLQMEFLCCFSRTAAIERVEELADRLEILARSGLICGVAVAGPEKGKPVRPFRHALNRVREAGLKIEIHAGEWAGPESVKEALDFIKPDRIGHGVTAFEDAELLARLKDQRVHIEMCPTSNVCTRAVTRLEQHPIRKAREMGLNISINTDDPGTFSCDIASEYGLLQDVFQFSADDVDRLTRDALAARFKREVRGPLAGVAE
jgi:adenosine deaminase